MQLSVNGKQLDIGTALKDHIEREMPAIVGKYFANPTDADVTVSKEGQSFRTDIAVHVGKGIIVQGHARSVDPYAATNDSSTASSPRPAWTHRGARPRGFGTCITRTTSRAPTRPSSIRYAA